MIEFIKNWHFLIIMLTLAAVLVYIWLYLNRNKLNAKWWEILIVTILCIVIGTVFTKIFAIIEVGFDVNKAGNMSMYGVVFFMPIFFVIYGLIKKLKISVIFDVFCIPEIVTLLFARINCLHAGCCIGKVIDGNYRYPTREIEIMFYVIFILIMVPKVYKGFANGFTYPIFMISYGIARFVIESFREADVSGFMHRAHYWSIISFVVGTIFLILLILKVRRAKTNGNE